ncbi:MAG: hypothetical protein EOP04_25905 [Proteobacteria bacterium]|jgi:hypothetical protein|nr:MAG: hypothetical protein EOP04_25905 [Pseudomonadota bacterium]
MDKVALVAAVGDVVDNKTLLGWYFNIASITFGVLGFVYGVYANAALMEKDHLYVIRFIKFFCIADVAVLAFVTFFAGYTTLHMDARFEVKCIVGAFVLLTVFSIVLVWKIKTPPIP